MGATNVKHAYAAWAGKVPPNSMICLVYMALVSMDSDRNPWFGQGHEALAQHALGREAPLSDNEARADVRAVERAVGPLLTAGAIVADRRPAPRGSGPRTVRYRLMLPAPTEDVPRNASDDRPTDSVTDDPRFPAGRPTESVQTPHENRGTEEEEETGGEKGGVDQSARAPEADRPSMAQPDGLTDEPSRVANGKARRAADEIAARRWLGEEYYLPDDLATQVIAIAEKRSATPIDSLVPYLRRMQQDKDGNPKRDLADIVEAVQLHGHQVDDGQEVVGSLRDAGLSTRAIAAATGISDQTVRADLSQVRDFTQQPPVTGTDGKTYAPTQLAAVPPTVTGPSPQRGPGKAAMAALDATHAKICNTPGCERCARVRAEQELASA